MSQVPGGSLSDNNVSMPTLEVTLSDPSFTAEFIGVFDFELKEATQGWTKYEEMLNFLYKSVHARGYGMDAHTKLVAPGSLIIAFKFFGGELWLPYLTDQELVTDVITSTSLTSADVVPGSVMPPLGPQTFDAVVFLGDSITNPYEVMFADSNHWIYTYFAEHYGVRNGISYEASGMSGHTTKTFTEKFLGDTPVSAGKILSELETELEGKKVLFVDVLRTNDWKNITAHGVDPDVQKAETTTWTQTLAEGINNSSLDATYIMARQPYTDWRGINVRGTEGFDIIDGTAPDTDQTVFWTAFVKELSELHSPQFMYNGRNFFDTYTVTRNHFRYWFSSDTDSVHAGISTPDILADYYMKRVADLRDIGVGAPDVPLYAYPTQSAWSIGDEAVIDFSRDFYSTITDQGGFIKHENINMVSIMQRRPTLVSTTGKDLAGRSFVEPSSFRVTGGSGGGTAPNTDLADIQNHYLLKAGMYVRDAGTDTIKVSGLPVGATMVVEYSAAYDGGASQLDCLGQTATIADTTKVTSAPAPTASMTVTVPQNGILEFTLSNPTGTGIGPICGMSLKRTA